MVNICFVKGFPSCGLSATTVLATLPKVMAVLNDYSRRPQSNQTLKPINCLQKMSWSSIRSNLLLFLHISSTEKYFYLTFGSFKLFFLKPHPLWKINRDERHKFKATSGQLGKPTNFNFTEITKTRWNFKWKNLIKNKRIICNTIKINWLLF